MARPTDEHLGGSKGGRKAALAIGQAQQSPYNDANVNALVLLDHDNVPHDAAVLRSVITSWVPSMPDAQPVAFLNVRAYGGWYRDTAVSNSRFEAADYYQQNCPSLLRVGEVLCRLTFSFADRVLNLNHDSQIADGPTITHTVATRSAPLHADRRAQAPTCAESDCEIRTTQRWIKKKRACPKPGCPHLYGDFFTRSEQKQVDVHLAVDLIRGVLARYDAVVLVSEDWDILPAILAAVDLLLPGQRLILVRVRRGVTYLDAYLAEAGVTVVNASPDSA